MATVFLKNKSKMEFLAETAAAAALAEAEALANCPYDPVTGPTLKAPMGGTVIEIDVKPGDKVKVHQKMLVYEAMKMENDLESEIEGTVKQVLVQVGDVVATDQDLIEYE